MNFRVSWLLLGAIALYPQSLLAQTSITPAEDGTNTTVNYTGIGSTYTIENGTLSGDHLNLFHSFGEFGLNAGESAVFTLNNNGNIINVLGRVVGGNPSLIQGKIAVSGGNNPNLFLMNPAGIIFGSGASLSVPGDFTATTATGIGFGGDRWFNALGNNDYLNLQGNPFIFAFDLSQPGAIINLGNLKNMQGNLTLLGGTVVSAGSLETPNGNLLVSAVPGSSLIRISQPGTLLSLEIEPPRNADGSLANIQAATLPELLTGDLAEKFTSEDLDNLGEINASAIDSGDIYSVDGFVNDTLMVADNNLTLTQQFESNGGDIILQAGENIVTGNLESVAIFTDGSDGGGGKIDLDAGNNITVTGNISTSGQWGGNVNLYAENGAIEVMGDITTIGIYGEGGAIALNANGTIQLENLESYGYGDGGDMQISSNWGDIVANNLRTFSIAGHGGEVAIAARGKAETNNMNTFSLWGHGGDVGISADEGIETGNIRTESYGWYRHGGAIALQSSDGEITTGIVNSSAMQGYGGNIDLQALDDIQVSYINAEGGLYGGDVYLSSNNFIRVTNSFTSLNGLAASISSAGYLGGGEIVISHGAQSTPFIVGAKFSNGTVGAITTGNYSILPYKLLTSDYSLGNIFIDFKDKIAIDPVENNNPNFNTSENLNFDENLDTDLRLFMSDSHGTLEEQKLHREQEIEERFSTQFSTHLGVRNTATKTPEQTRQTLRDIERLTGIKPALIYAFFTPAETPAESQKNSNKEEEKPLWQYPQNINSRPQNIVDRESSEMDSDRLELVIVTAEGGVIHRPLEYTREEVLETVKAYRRSVTNVRRPSSFLQPSKQLYRYLIAPVEDQLEGQEINNISLIMDSGLRSIPVAALHDGERFIIEKYSMGMMPSFSLTDTSYEDIRDRPILAMGADRFEQQSPLPAVAVELPMIAETLADGDFYLNEKFTLDNFHAARQKKTYSIVHLATHGEFNPGVPSNSYIQFWDRKLTLDRLQELDLDSPQVELLVLSACRTALGDEEAELGFSGLAISAGVKSALGSLWYVSDEGALAFMSQFYNRLQVSSTKAEALRLAQLAMLNGDIRIEGGQLVTPLGAVELPPELAGLGDRDLAHPYYWSAFTLVGNPW